MVIPSERSESRDQKYRLTNLSKLMPDTREWYFYIVRCTDGSYYTGIALDPFEREREHNLGQGAAYTARRRPVKLIYWETHPTKSAARKRELQVKPWRKEKKEWLIHRFPSSSSG